MQYITAYQPKERHQISFGTKSRTKQAHAKEADINYIMRKYLKTGLIEHSRNHQPDYGFATSEDFHTSMNIITKANTMFEDLPSSIRSKFDNQPSQFLDFVNNENNKKEMQEMGLLNPYYQDPSTDNLEDTSKLEGENTDESQSDSPEKDS
jgi:phage internal scaffolding protein